MDGLDVLETFNGASSCEVFVLLSEKSQRDVMWNERGRIVSLSSVVFYFDIHRGACLRQYQLTDPCNYQGCGR
jgi:hypothetical protein